MSKPSKELPVVQESTPMQMLQLAVQEGHDLEKIEKLMELERQWKTDQAREAYLVALTKFKKKRITVTKDKRNDQYGSRYTSIGNLVDTVNSAMAPFGFSANWKVEQGDFITVTCVLTHTLGHSESVSLSGPPDDSGKKNTLQQIKSTLTYLEAATFQAVTGVVSKEANMDDDGNGAVDTITPSQLADLEALLDEVEADRDAFLKYCKVGSLEDLPAEKFKQAVKALEQKRK